MNPRYVFVVGSGRSGTTLLVRCLNRSDDIHILDETHFLGHLFRSGLRQDIAKFGSLENDRTVSQVVDYLYAVPYRGGGYWQWLLENVGKDRFLTGLLESDRSERAFFQFLMELQSQDEPVLGEKTPGHLNHVPTLLRWFPDAAIVHIIRDPRAVYVSETRFRLNQKGSAIFPFKQIEKLRLKRQSIPLYTTLYTTIVWSRVIHLHREYKELYSDNYYWLRFEHLVTEPEFHLRNLCRFLNVEFRIEMLDQTVTNSGFKSEEGKPGFDKCAADRWRYHINPVAKAWFSLLWKRYSRELDCRTIDGVATTREPFYRFGLGDDDE
jgi:hypothetical protein